jgi:tetratricopeptide (TPR) repeat protein
VVWLVVGFLLGTTAHADESADISKALVAVKSPKWDAKGKAIEPYAQGDAKRKKEEWGPAIDLLLASIDAQPGCGQCLNSLSMALTGARRYEDAAKVGEKIEALYPERKEGPLRVSTAWQEAREKEKSLEATERYLKLESEKADTDMWSRRNRTLLELGRVEDAEAALAKAPDAGVKESTVACLRIQLLAATDQAAAARALWTKCAEDEDVELRRASEGWLAMAEGDQELAAKRLVLAGSDDFARLTIAQMRLEAKQYEAALNLTTKVLEKNDWAWDAYLAKALALHGLGRDDEALAQLHLGPTADGWEQAHKKIDEDRVLLKPRGKEWPETVAEQSLALEIVILQAKGDTAGAKALYDKAVAVHGDRPILGAAMSVTPPG